MAAPGAVGLTDGQTLLYGGIISLGTAVIVLLLQALIQWRRQAYEERKAIRERLFEYDLERLRQVEEVMLEFRRVIQGDVRQIDESIAKVEEVKEKLFDILLLSSRELPVQTVLLNAADTMWSAAVQLLKIVADEIRSRQSVDMRAIRRGKAYMRKYGEVSAAIIHFLKLYRVKVLNEPVPKPKRKLRFWRKRGRVRPN